MGIESPQIESPFFSRDEMKEKENKVSIIVEPPSEKKKLKSPSIMKNTKGREALRRVLTLKDQNHSDIVPGDQNMKSNSKHIIGQKTRIKRNRTQKGERDGHADSSLGPMTGMTGSELEGLSIVESDDLYDSDENIAGKKYDQKI